PSGLGLMGMLSSFSIPAYQDYTKRTYVAEGMALATAARLASTEYYAMMGEWPMDNQAAGLPNADVIQGQGVDGITILPEGKVQINYSNHVQYGGYLILQGKVSAGGGSASWTCYETNLLAKVLPVNC